jgi:hypothetical protein
MGQYGNQPDFGTEAISVAISGASDNDTGATIFKPAALYIGTGGTLIANVVGGNSNGNYTRFVNIPNGTFFPVIVTNIWAEVSPGDADTTCSDIVALY